MTKPTLRRFWLNFQFGQRVLSFSDLHLHDDSHLPWIQKMCAVCRQVTPEILVLDGDIADPWIGRWSSLMLTKSWTELRALVAERFDAGLLTVWILGNHDSAAKMAFLGSVYLCRKFSLPPFEFRHGWEFDVVWNGVGWIPGVKSIAFWLVEHHPDFALRLWKWLNRVTRTKTPNEQRRCAHDSILTDGYLITSELMDDWNYHVGVIHLRATKYAMDHKVRLVIGHTHRPTNYGSALYDCGDMLDSFSYLDISTAGEAEIRFLEADHDA